MFENKFQDKKKKKKRRSPHLSEHRTCFYCEGTFIVWILDSRKLEEKNKKHCGKRDNVLILILP